MNAYIAKPFDVLYFRGNKSFDKGEWYSEGIFPPYPSTFQGLLRFIILKDLEMIKINGCLTDKYLAVEKVGDDENFPFDIIGPYLCNNDTFFFPTPFDTYIIEKNDKTEIAPIEISKSAIMTDMGFKFHYPVASHNKIKWAYYNYSYSTREEYAQYLKNITFEPSDYNPVEKEEHIGIELERPKNVSSDKNLSKNIVFTKKTQEPNFYLTPYNRLNKDVGLYFEIKNGLAEKVTWCSHIGKLGSEGRGVFFEKASKSLDMNKDDLFYSSLVEKKRFKLILLQPGVFKNGWIPFNYSKTEDDYITLTYEGLKLRLYYARTTKQLHIGGMSMRKMILKDEKNAGAGLKPMINAVPAGAVYYFEIMSPLPTLVEKQNAINILRKLNNSKIQNKPYSDMGFNHVILGQI